MGVRVLLEPTSTMPVCLTRTINQLHVAHVGGIGNSPVALAHGGGSDALSCVLRRVYLHPADIFRYPTVARAA